MYFMWIYDTVGPNSFWILKPYFKCMNVMALETKYQTKYHLFTFYVCISIIYHFRLGHFFKQMPLGLILYLMQ